MPRSGGDAAHMRDMLEYARDVVRFTAGLSFPEYLADRMRQLAVERGVEIVGEAANRVSAAGRTSHSSIPWRKIIDQRHVLAHDYNDIQQAKIWEVATVHAPLLVEYLERVLPPEPPASRAGWEAEW